ncbi:M14 family zinc carboxypeptidase [Aliikangiella marina]|uniref:M14 family zinc carboxypeptidase n=1 Tax=Aliikangiella marina TaxID=1712262 RepID=UPI00163DC592|nr:M14 family zinc carboxypeptidase [Aliikangiella marina]
MIKIIFLVIATLSVLSIQAHSDIAQLKAFKVATDNKQLARKVAISFHHAVLESHIDKGYLILELNDQDLRKLSEFDLKISSADKWLEDVNAKFAQLKSLKREAGGSKASSLSMFGVDGIPGYECYLTVEETYAEATRLEQEYPQLAEWIDIGDSWSKINSGSGYDLMVLKITNQAIVKDKPILFIHSAMHAREYTPAALTLDFAKLLLEDYATNPDSQWIVDQHEVHILFHMNPDGRKIAEGQILQRKNTNQNHCPGGNVGVDLNRNFAQTWNSTTNGSSGVACDSTYRGSSPESEPETQAVSNYIRSIFPDRRGPNDDDAAPEDTQGMHIDVHSYSQLVLWPYGHKQGASPNDAAFVEMGHKLAWFNNYAPMQSVGLYPTDGTSDNVSYGELGIPAITFELGTEFFQSCTTYNFSVKNTNLNALSYAAKIVGAPYQIPFGPDISRLTLNGSNQSVSITAGTQVELSVTASATRTALSGGERNVDRIEYSLGIPVWQETATREVIFDNPNASAPTTQTAQATINTDTLPPGQHLVYVRAINSQGQAGAVSAGMISVGENASPSASFTANCADLSCQFDASASLDPDGSIESYQWDFGDGNVAEGVTSSYVFASEGEKEVTLTVTDNSGALAVTSETLTVSSPATPPPQSQPPSSSSGGGGLVHYWLLFIGLVMALTRRRKQA